MSTIEISAVNPQFHPNHAPWDMIIALDMNLKRIKAELIARDYLVSTERKPENLQIKLRGIIIEANTYLKSYYGGWIIWSQKKSLAIYFEI